MTDARYTRRAERDLDEIAVHIAKDDPVAAQHWLARVAERMIVAAATPRAGRVVPELNRADIREVIVRPHRIMYRVAAERIVVLVVLDSHRLFPADLDPDDEP